MFVLLSCPHLGHFLSFLTKRLNTYNSWRLRKNKRTTFMFNTKLVQSHLQIQTTICTTCRSFVVSPRTQNNNYSLSIWNWLIIVYKPQFIRYEWQLLSRHVSLQQLWPVCTELMSTVHYLCDINLCRSLLIISRGITATDLSPSSHSSLFVRKLDHCCLQTTFE